MLTSKSVQEFLNETASSSPAPGGGSVSALAAALGAALTSMVCRLTIGKKKYAEVQAEMEDVLGKSEGLRNRCTSIIDEDTQAFNKLMQVYSLPKETPEQHSARKAAVQEALKTATLVPLKLMQLCEEAGGLAKTVAEKGNRNSSSDAGVSALMLRAACMGAALNVRINLAGLDDAGFVQETRTKCDKFSERVSALCQGALDAVNKNL